MYFENHKTLLRKILKELNEWKDILCLQIRRLNIVKMALLSNCYTDPIRSLSKSHLVSLQKLTSWSSNSHGNSKTKNSQYNLNKELSCRSHTSWFQNFLQSNSSQSSLILGKKRLTYKLMRQNWEFRNNFIFMQMIFDKDAKTTRQGKEKSLNKWW